MEDPLNPEWRIVRDVEPRSRRVTSESEDESLSAPGRVDATRNIPAATEVAAGGSERTTEPILGVDVAHVLAHEESNDEAGHDDLDHVDDIIEEEVVPVDDSEFHYHGRDFLDNL